MWSDSLAVVGESRTALQQYGQCYHEKTGSWVPVPLAWEGQVPGVVKLIKDIQVTMVIRETMLTC